MNRLLILQLPLYLIALLPARADELSQAEMGVAPPKGVIELGPGSLPHVIEGVQGQDPAAAGFVRSGRVMLRSASFQEESVSGLLRGVVGPMRLDLNATSDRYTLMHEELDRFRGSIEMMGQHLWRHDAGILTQVPAWRLGIHTQGFALDVGELPFASPSLTRSASRQAASPQPWSTVSYFSYGVRADTTSGYLRFDGITDVAGRMFSQTDHDDLLIGPQLAVGQVAQRGRWLFDYSALVLAGYRRTDTQQLSGFGDDAVPGRFNYLLSPRPTYSRYGEQTTSYPIMGELRLITSYFFDSGLSLDLLANAVVEPTRQSATQVVEYSAPDFGIGASVSDSGSVVVGNLYLSLTYLR